MNNYVHESLSATLQIRDASLSNGYVTIATKQDGTSSMLLPPAERQAAAQALAGDDYHVIPTADWQIYKDVGRENETLRATVEKLREHRDALKRQVTDLYGKLDAQPDRPEPVDPASVRVGQVVEVEADDGSWMVRGEVGQVGTPGTDYYIQVWIDHEVTGAIRPCIPGNTVRVLHAAGPEPDEAAQKDWAAARIRQEMAS